MKKWKENEKINNFTLHKNNAHIALNVNIKIKNIPLKEVMN